jgi:hypothetical protein
VEFSPIDRKMRLVGLVLLFCALAHSASDVRRWKGEKELSAWLVCDVALNISATERVARRHFVVTYSVRGWVRVAGSFDESDSLDVRFNDELKEGEWVALRQEHECRATQTTGEFTSFSITDTRNVFDPRLYCESRVAPSHAEIMLGECAVRLRVSYFGMWHTAELTRHPPCQLDPPRQHDEL